MIQLNLVLKIDDVEGDVFVLSSTLDERLVFSSSIEKNRSLSLDVVSSIKTRTTSILFSIPDSIILI